MSGEMLKDSHNTKKFTSQINKIKQYMEENEEGAQKRLIMQMGQGYRSLVHCSTTHTLRFLC